MFVKKVLLIITVMGLVLAAGLFLPLTSSAGFPVPPAPPLPPMFIPAPPSVVLIPGTYTYYAPDVEGELLFSGGRWYRPHDGRWYAADHYKGPWAPVPQRNVPQSISKLPHGYRSMSPGRERIPHDQLRSNWRTWERDKHWDSPGRSGKSETRHMNKEVKKQHEKEPQHGSAVKNKERGKEHGKEHGKEEKSLKKETKDDKHGKGKSEKKKSKQEKKHGSDKEHEKGDK